MIVEIAKLVDEPLRMDQVVPKQELQFRHEDARLATDVASRMTLTLLERKIVRVEGRCRTEMDFQCSRCLKTFTKAENLDFDLCYAPQASVSAEREEIELSDEDMDFGFYDGIQLDTNQILAEQLVFAVPMKPLCSDLCRGLCPYCGTDLNVARCECAEPTGGALEEKLRDIKKYLESKKSRA